MKTLFRLFGTSCIVYILGCAGGTDTDALDFYGALARTLISLILCTVWLYRGKFMRKARKGKKSCGKTQKCPPQGKCFYKRP